MKIKVYEYFRVKLIQWNSDAYDQDLVERTRDACKGDVDIVLGCLGLGAPLQRSFKCLKKGGTAFVTEEINEKVLKSLQKMAEQQTSSRPKELLALRVDSWSHLNSDKPVPHSHALKISRFKQCLGK